MADSNYFSMINFIDVCLWNKTKDSVWQYTEAEDMGMDEKFQGSSKKLKI
jgi:hypothetical protein